MSADRDAARVIGAGLLPGLVQTSRQFEAVLSYVADVAVGTGEDAERILQEARALAAASTMTVEQATRYVAAEKQREYSKRERDRLSAAGGGYCPPQGTPTG